MSLWLDEVNLLLSDILNECPTISKYAFSLFRISAVCQRDYMQTCVTQRSARAFQDIIQRQGARKIVTQRALSGI